MNSKRIVWAIVIAGLVIAIVGSLALLFSSREAAALDGIWIARMQRPGQPPYNIRLRFFVSDHTVTGQIEYPDRTEAILNGSVTESHLSFATDGIAYNGEMRGREIALTATTATGTATGTARKTR